MREQRGRRRTSGSVRAFVSALLVVAACSAARAAPMITSIDPAMMSEPGGRYVTIALAAPAVITVVRFQGQDVNLVTPAATRFESGADQIDPTHVRVLVPPRTDPPSSRVWPATVNVMVQDASGMSNAMPFTYLVRPTVIELWPSVACDNSSIEVWGTDIRENANLRVEFGPGNFATVMGVSMGYKISVIVPAGTVGSTVDVTITNDWGTEDQLTSANSLPFTYTWPPCTFSGIASGSDDWDFFRGGKEIVLEGTVFHEGYTTVTFAGEPATVTEWTSDTEITAMVPPAPAAQPEGYVALKVVNSNAGGQQSSSIFYYVDEPPYSVVTSPSDGATAGGTITVAADALDDRAVTGVLFQYSTGDPVTGPWTDIAAEVTTAPYSAEFDTTIVPDGPCHFRAVATDDHTASAVNTAGQQSTASASVTVTISQPVPEDGGCGAGAGGSCAGMLLWLGAAALAVARRRPRR